MHTKSNTKAAKKDETGIQSVAVVTLGCSKNTVDSETLMGHIRAQSLNLVEQVEGADAVVINTCGFIDRAKEESVNTILEAVELKRTGLLKKVVVAGCLSERYGEELKTEIPEVDHFFGVSAFEPIVKTLTGDYKYNLLGERVLTTPQYFAYLKISEGCDNPCSFCAIPLMRGGHKSRLPEEILAEAVSLARQGVKELVLIGQDLTYYGLDLYRRRTLADLLCRLSDIEGIRWIRLMYAYPSKFPKDILPVMAERENICKYLDMPLQHAATDVLKSMRRGITRRTTEALLDEIRTAVPDIALRTTFICGYPAETQENFEELCDFVEQQKFDRVGVFPYSQEDNTYAHILGDQHSEEEKQRRCAAVMDIQREISLEKNTAKIGSTIEVLIEQEYEGGEYQGRSRYDAPEVDNEVFVRSPTPLSPGDFVKVRIDDAAEYDIFGEYVGQA